MSSSHNLVARLFAGALLSLLPTLASAATVTVVSSVTPNGSLYHYDYSIANGTANDAFLLDLSVPANPSAITDLVAPAGFKAAFDSGLGLVSFLEDTSMFTSTALDGFSFDSSFGPGPGSFTASLLDSSSNIYTVAGSVMVPTAAVPEPNFFAVFAGIAALAIFGAPKLRKLIQQ